MVSLGQPQDTMRMLIERLSWPVRMARWQAAREYGALLSDPKRGAIAGDIFLEWLSARTLESEVASSLAVLFGTQRDDLPSFSAVIQAIQRPSVLADGMLQFVYGPGKVMDTWRQAHSSAAPSSFEPDAFFVKHKSAHAPPILGTTLEHAEKKSGLPFVKQWAFEWQSLMVAEDAPRSGFPYYFCNSIEHRSGLNGQFSQRQCDVYRSAYLRTLAYAVDVWKMPSDRAKQMCLDTLPASPGLMQVKPTQRPAWIGDQPEQYWAGNRTVGALVESLTESASASGRRPIHLRLPLSMEVAEHSELLITAVLATDDFALDEKAEGVMRNPLLWVLEGGFLVKGALPEEAIGEYIVRGHAGSCAPLSLDVWPIPVGFWHNDYLQAGMRFPAPYVFDGTVVATCEEDSIMFSQEGRPSGTWRVWHDYWTPLYPKDGATRVGMLTELHEDFINHAQRRHGLRLGWIVRTKVWKRASEFGDLELTERREFVFE